MPNLLPAHRGSLTRRDKARLRIFEQGIGKDLVGVEIDEALEWLEFYGANPWARDIYFFTFGKPGTKERRVVPVLSIQMYRKQAERTGNYRPDPNPTRFTLDEGLIGPANPKGIVSAEVTVYKHTHGEWWPITQRVSWDERAPIVEEGSEGAEWVDSGETWPDSGKPKKVKVMKGEIIKMLDPKKPNWRTMPETMLEKCAEAAAIRRGWPEAVSGAYADGELDKAGAIELTATEVLNDAKREERQARLGTGNSILVDWLDGKAIVAVPADKLHGLTMDFLKKHLEPGHEEFSHILRWQNQNREALRQFWGMKPEEALSIKAELERVAARAAEADKEESPG